MYKFKLELRLILLKAKQLKKLVNERLKIDSCPFVEMVKF